MKKDEVYIERGKEDSEPGLWLWRVK